MNLERGLLEGGVSNSMKYKGLWWAFADSNRGPFDYESNALTS